MKIILKGSCFQISGSHHRDLKVEGLKVHEQMTLKVFDIYFLCAVSWNFFIAPHISHIKLSCNAHNI